MSHVSTRAGISLAVLSLTAGMAQAQQASPLPNIVVNGAADRGYATQPDYTTDNADLGPLGAQPIKDSPQSVTVVPEDLIINQQAKSVNDTLRYLPSVEVRDQQGFEVSRPQSRGFQGSVVQNTRMDGLNVIGTSALPSENLSGIQVLNGLAGTLYGPETPAGVFDYELKRPTSQPLYRYIESFDSDGIFTEQVDASVPIGKVGLRLNALHGDGEGYVSNSSLDRSLVSGALDYHFDDQTVIEANYFRYETDSRGTPGSIVYGDGVKSTFLPPAIDPTRLGYGQPGAGADLITNLGLIKIKHSFNEDWNIEIGGLYDDAIRNLLGITNTLTDDRGDYTVTKNFTAVPHFTIGSNSAYLHGKFDVAGMRNDVTVGTNGFVNGQYSSRTSIAVSLGTSNLANPAILPTKPTPNNGGQYESGLLSVQSLITGDTIHFNDQLALQAVLSTSFLHSESHNAAGVQTSADTRNGALSPTVSLTYKPIAPLTTYATVAHSVEQGETAAANNLNASQILAPYHDQEYEIGAKYAVSDNLLVTLDGFRMTRPLAGTVISGNPKQNGLFEVLGTQRNWGAEFFVQGEASNELSILGGVTYIDARLINTGNPATNDGMVVGVPRYKTDIALDYHPAFGRGLALTGAFHDESKRAATDLNNSYAPAYSTYDLGARYTAALFQHPVTLRFQVINLTDVRYYSSVADGNIVGSPGADTAYSGAPRTFQASLEVGF